MMGKTEEIQDSILKRLGALPAYRDEIQKRQEDIDLLIRECSSMCNVLGYALKYDLLPYMGQCSGIAELVDVLEDKIDKLDSLLFKQQQARALESAFEDIPAANGGDTD